MRVITNKTSLLLSLAVFLCSACGNKGDLYLIPDDLSDENLRRLEQVLALEDIPAADDIEVDDFLIYEAVIKPDVQTDNNELDE